MSEKIIDKKIMFYGTSTLLLTIVSIIVRTFCFFFAFDAGIEYYRESFLSGVLTGLCVSSTAFLVSAFIMVKKNTVTGTGRENNLVIKCASGVVAALALYSLIVYAGEIFYLNSRIIAIVGVVGALLSVVYFVYNYFAENNSERATQSLFGFGIIIVSIIVMFISYFDVYELMNAPNKIYLHLALITLMLFVLNEIRAYAGEINKSFYLFSLISATFFCGVSSIPTLIYYFSVSTNTKYLPHNVVLAGVFFYLVARLVTFTLASVEEKTENDI